MRTTLSIETPKPSFGNGHPEGRRGSSPFAARERTTALPGAANEPAFEPDGSQAFPAVAWARSSPARFGWVDAGLTVAVMLYFAAALATMASEI